ncbi:hypothetical protein AU255_09510 [Methyloprofundus sedimenti]|uniref:C4-dicarboxylate ABC transporter n=1 Tax=Methyloprofundus sedimenti TaxID=1420851 RepID=A0A1V8M962_9GAMM|nr:hypothetical protein [Methyloprofundus sedimenti]OQK18068.1 hypothetical protein AU255_09510 [Methyloprofundus sedimenti]
MQKKYAGLKFCTRVILLAFCCAFSVYAVDSITFNVNQITADDWALKNAILTLSQLNQTPQISLASATLVLPSPLEHITSVSVQCQQIEWHENYLNCTRGLGRFHSKQFKTLAFDFSLQVNHDKSKLEINHLSLFGGQISIYAQENAEKWQVHIKAKNINLVDLNAMFVLDFAKITQGLVDFEIKLTGNHDIVQTLLVSAVMKNLSMHDESGGVASDNVMLVTELNAVKQKNGWQWHNNSRIQEGGLFVDPVFLQVDKNNLLALTANGFWQPDQKKIQIDMLTFEHPEAILLQGNARLNYHAGLSIEEAALSVHIAQLKSAAPVYLLPFLESGVFAGIDLTGSIDAELQLKLDSVSEVNIELKNLVLNAAEQGLYINQANAQINWAKHLSAIQASFINWQQLKIHAIPFQAGQLDFISFDRQLKLLKQADLAVLGGILSINNFSFAAVEINNDATVHFDGSINNLSLEKLSTALNWEPLSGTINGYIPSVRYEDKTLSLDGKLKMQVFDGEVSIKNLASSGLFSHLPQFHADIEFDNLDLGVITRKFNTGYIEGRLSGFVQNLYLENWQPVSFYAWLGTPEDDNSTHRISQKAVENIASIGGGGATDVLSRGFLGLFKTFGYNKLGFGCYLHQGVCQLMGVEAIDNGFYLIKGGGLPRIDIIGYNPRLDWNVLINRLKRITASDQVIIE